MFFLFLVVVAANLPDLDFLPGLMVGDEGHFHRGASHSLLVAGLAASMLGLLLRHRLGGFRRVAGWSFLAIASHLVLDIIVPDPSGKGSGIALLWPFIDVEVSAPIPFLTVFDPIRWLDGAQLQAGVLRAMLSFDGLRIFLVDAALVTPLVPLAWGVRRFRERRAVRGSAAGSLLPPSRTEKRRVRRRRSRVQLAPEVELTQR